MFYSSPEWCRSHGEAIKKMFGPYPASVATKICNIVKKIITYLPEESENEENNEEQNIEEKEFGLDIKFKYSSNLLSDVLQTVSLLDSLSGSEDEENTRHEDLIIKSLLNGLAKSHDHHKPSQVVKKTKSAVVTSKYGTQWLEKQCKMHCVTGLSWKQLHTKLFDILVSDIEGAAIENEVRMY